MQSLCALFYPPIETLPRVNHLIFFGLNFPRFVTGVGALETIGFLLDRDDLVRKENDIGSGDRRTYPQNGGKMLD